MDSQKITTMREVKSTFAAWKRINDQIHELQQQAPAGREAELQAMEAEAERLLLIASHALLKIKTPRSSNGDSTWG
jgi:hypothetical protein